MIDNQKWRNKKNIMLCYKKPLWQLLGETTHPTHHPWYFYTIPPTRFLLIYACNLGFWAVTVPAVSVPTIQSRRFSPSHFSPETIQSKTIQSWDISVQDISVQDDSVRDISVLRQFSPRWFSPGCFSPRQFSPGCFSPRQFSPRWFSPETVQSETIQSWDNSVQDDSVPGQFSPEWPDLSTFLANSVGLYTIQNYKDCKQYKFIKIVNNTKLYELFISPGNLQDGLHQVYE